MATVLSINGRELHGDERRWRIMADRAERLLGELETGGRPDASPDADRLAEEILALRTALREATLTRTSAMALFEAGFECGRGAVPVDAGPAPAAARPALYLVGQAAE
jgi:hypothetical protein